MRNQGPKPTENVTTNYVDAGNPTMTNQQSQNTSYPEQSIGQQAVNVPQYPYAQQQAYGQQPDYSSVGSYTQAYNSGRFSQPAFAPQQSYQQQAGAKPMQDPYQTQQMPGMAGIPVQPSPAQSQPQHANQPFAPTPQQQIPISTGQGAPMPSQATAPQGQQSDNIPSQSSGKPKRGAAKTKGAKPGKVKSIKTTSQKKASEKKDGKKNKLLIAGLLVCGIAAIILSLTLLFIFKPFGLFEEVIEAEPLSSMQVEAAYMDASIPEPDLEDYKYINDKDLKRKSLDDFEFGETVIDKDGSPKVYCNTKAIAVYENDSVQVTQHLSMKMIYNLDNKQWQAGAVHDGTPDVAPTGPPVIDAIASDFASILKSYEPKLATMYDGIKPTIGEADLSKTGGKAAFKLEGKEKGTDRNIAMTVQTEVSWEAGTGWVVKVESVEGDTEPTPQQTAANNTNQENSAALQPPAAEQPNGGQDNAGSNGGTNAGGNPSGGGNNGGTTNGGGNQPTMQLVCFSGELVQVPGTVQFDSSGRVLLRTDDLIKVVFNNNTYITSYFEITGSGNWTNGKHLTLLGEISGGGTLPQAPLVINTDYE